MSHHVRQGSQEVSAVNGKSSSQSKAAGQTCFLQPGREWKFPWGWCLWVPPVLPANPLPLIPRSPHNGLFNASFCLWWVLPDYFFLSDLAKIWQDQLASSRVGSLKSNDLTGLSFTSSWGSPNFLVYPALWYTALPSGMPGQALSRCWHSLTCGCNFSLSEAMRLWRASPNTAPGQGEASLGSMEVQGAWS